MSINGQAVHTPIPSSISIHYLAISLSVHNLGGKVPQNNKQIKLFLD